jgi:ABC-type cobalt transport system substrate-binding protein
LIQTQGADINIQSDENDTHFIYYYIHLTPIVIISLLFSLISLNKMVLMVISKIIMVLLYSTWHVDIFKTLIENNGGDINIKDNRGYTPFYYSLFEPQLGIHDTILQYFLHQGAALM